MVRNPVISVNKPGEYVISRAARQRSLLRERKYPSEDYQHGSYYSESVNAIQKFLGNGAIDPRVVENEIASLNQRTPSRIETIRRINSNIDRLNRFLDMLDDIDFKNGVPEVNRKSDDVTLHGVRITVKPLIVLRGAGPRKQELVGAMMLHMSVHTNFNEEAAGYVSAIVQEYCKRFLVRTNELVHAPYCQVIDVGNQTVWQGVKSTRRRMKDIESECQNIKALWESI